MVGLRLNCSGNERTVGMYDKAYPEGLIFLDQITSEKGL